MIYSEHIVKLFRERLSSPLPGLDAHMKMAPSVRGRELKVPENARKSGVLVLLYPHENEELHVVLMKRSEDGHAHSGQVSFPGGRWEEEDPDFIFTALREAEEEVGVSKDQVEVIGTLSELYIPPSNFLVYPTLGFSHQRPDFIPDPREVAMIIEAKLKIFYSGNSIGEFKVNASGGLKYKAPGYLVNGHVVWGATAMMLSELGSIVREIGFSQNQ